MRNRNNEFRDCVIAVCLIVFGFVCCTAATTIQIILLQNAGLLWIKIFIKHWSLFLYLGIVPMFAGFAIGLKYA